MPEVNDPDPEFEAANSRLNQGLKSCRSVVNNYKALLSTDQNDLLLPHANDEREIDLPAER